MRRCCAAPLVAARTNTSGFNSGGVMIGYMDLFTSIPSPPDETFAIFDNVRVLMPVTPPVILVQPMNRLVNAGASAAFAVVTGGPPACHDGRPARDHVPSLCPSPDGRGGGKRR